MGSASARLLATALGALRVRPDGAFRPRAGDFIINWGKGTVPTWWPPQLEGQMVSAFLNHPRNVAVAANKLATFQRLRQWGVSIPEFTTDPNVAYIQYPRAYARYSLTGHSGAGIQVLVASQHHGQRPAPLYVKAIENDGEYRVHVVNGRVIDYIKKRRRNGERPTNEENDIRNLANGWVYTRENLRRLERIEQLAIDAVTALGLDFGAVDIIKDPEGNVFVLEVNTACGMSETTLRLYSEAFSELIEQHASNN